ncbi:MAG: hypothetical protein ACR2GY_09665, partial [Phycisphaerales bacterium]
MGPTPGNSERSRRARLEALEAINVIATQVQQLHRRFQSAVESALPHHARAQFSQAAQALTWPELY